MFTSQVFVILTDVTLDVGFQPIPLAPALAGYGVGPLLQILSPPHVLVGGILLSFFLSWILFFLRSNLGLAYFSRIHWVQISINGIKKKKICRKYIKKLFFRRSHSCYSSISVSRFSFASSFGIKQFLLMDHFSKLRRLLLFWTFFSSLYTWNRKIKYFRL